MLLLGRTGLTIQKQSIKKELVAFDEKKKTGEEHLRTNKITYGFESLNLANDLLVEEAKGSH